MNTTTDAIRKLCTAHASVDSPFGRVLLARSACGLTGVWFEGQKHHPAGFDLAPRPHDELLARAAAQLSAYFAGGAAAFELPLDLQGTPFQRSVWQALLAIPAGTTTSYAAIAAALGTRLAVRAVAGAVGRNPLSVVVPCHRVLGSDGSLTGYAGGLERKRRLLLLEGGPAAARSARALN